MVRTASTMLPLGAALPAFELADVTTGKSVCENDVIGEKGLLVMFICRHCPYVIHIQDELSKLAVDFRNSGVGIVAISSNDAENYPEDSPEKLAEMASDLSFAFPYLYDEAQTAAHSYRAACTPDFFLFNNEKKLVYRGQFDSSRPGSAIPVTGEDLRKALDNLCSEQPIDTAQQPSLGCNIKWKPGNEPDFF